MKITAALIGYFHEVIETSAQVSGEVITVDGASYDLSSIPEGGEARPTGNHPFNGPITRQDGVLHVPLLWRYNAYTADPHQGTEHPVLTVANGPVPDPVNRKPVEEPA